MKIARLLESSNDDKPWIGPNVRHDALKFQSELLELDDDISVELCAPKYKLLHDARVSCGREDRFSNIALNVTYASKDKQAWTYQLLIYYRHDLSTATDKLYPALFIGDKDHATFSAREAFKSIKNMAEDREELLYGKYLGFDDEQVKEALANAPSSYTLLSRFAKELVAKGFDAEVKSNSKPGVINSSKLCIEVKGYGMSDVIKLYKPLWKHEQGVLAFVDAKTEQRFSIVPEMVEKLKAKYPKLPKCLFFVPKSEKLKESSNGQLNIKERILKLQTDLIEQLPDDTKLSDIITCRGRAYGAHGHEDTRFDRYVIIVECTHYLQPNGVIHYVITVDDLDTVEVNGVKRPASDGLVVATVYMVKGSERPSFELLQKFDYSKKQLSPTLKPVWGSDEATSGRQEGLDQLVNWLVLEADHHDD